MKYVCLAFVALFLLAGCKESEIYEKSYNYEPQTLSFYVHDVSVQEISTDVIMEIDKVERSYDVLEMYSISMYAHTSEITLIAHAGGAVHGYESTNSIEAIKNAHNLNFRYIELDMIITSDGRVVLKHSWETAANIFGGMGNDIMSYYEFMGQTIHGRFTPTDICMLIAFLGENPGPRIVTDTKDTDYAALYEIALRFPEYMYRFIPQVYQFGDANRIRALGFDDIILTSYMLRNRDPVLMRDYVLQNDIYAVGIPDALATAAFVAELDPSSVQIFVHTVDDINRAEYLMGLGVQMIMTAFLAYTDDLTCIQLTASPLNNYYSLVATNIQNLNQSEKEFAEIAIFYRMGNPVYVIFGEALPISGDMNRMVEIFVSSISGYTYFALRNFNKLTEDIMFNGHNRSLHININGRVYLLSGDDFHIYRSSAFVSEALVEELFGLKMIRCLDYIVLVPYGYTHFEEELFHVARKIFKST